MIQAIMLDSREPTWVQELKFGGIPTAVTTLDTGDVWAVTDDGHTLMIERKTPDDFLNTLRDERLFTQLAKLGEKRQIQLENNIDPTYWSYLVITGQFLIGKDGKVSTPERSTGWTWASLQGAILSIQEMGILVVHAASDLDFEACILRLGERDRSSVMKILPPRQALMLGAKESLLASLPGIGVERSVELMKWANGRLCDALMGLTDLAIPCPVQGIGEMTRKRIRTFLGLQDTIHLEIGAGAKDEETLVLMKG